MKPKINFEKFTQLASELEITLGTIQSVERVPKSDKMLKLAVFFTETDQRTVLTNIGNKINPNDLLFITLPFITNLEPVKMMGILSEAMIMVPELGGTITLTASSGATMLP